MLCGAWESLCRARSAAQRSVQKHPPTPCICPAPMRRSTNSPPILPCRSCIFAPQSFAFPGSQPVAARRKTCFVREAAGTRFAGVRGSGLAAEGNRAGGRRAVQPALLPALPEGARLNSPRRDWPGEACPRKTAPVRGQRGSKAALFCSGCWSSAKVFLFSTPPKNPTGGKSTSCRESFLVRNTAHDDLLSRWDRMKTSPKRSSTRTNAI
jgi:hypothetical protein